VDNSNIIVLKFGGTSVKDLDRINAVTDIIVKKYQRYKKIVVVVSAMSQETNRLIQYGLDLGGDIADREMDALLTTGEQVSMALLTMAIKKRGIKAFSLTGWQIPIQTNGVYSNARITNIDTQKILAQLTEQTIVVIPGFQGVDLDGNLNTLGRGGSDTSAVAISVSLKARVCEIYTDVKGVYTADPRICQDARKIEALTFEEMAELASEGSKVLHVRSVLFAAKNNIELRVLSSFEQNVGTVVSNEEKINQMMEKTLVTGIAHKTDEAKISIIGVADKPGVAHQIFKTLSNQNIYIDIIVQNVGQNGKNDISITIKQNQLKQALAILQKIQCDQLICNDNITTVTVVGFGMKSHSGVATVVFETLAKENINIDTITTSEIKITVLISKKYTELAVRALHKAFKLDQEKGMLL